MLRAVLEEARGLGYLGPGPVEEHIAHAEAMLAHVPEQTERLLDLGTGGGVPGLVLAQALTATRVTLLEGGDRRATFLRSAVQRLDLAERCTVVAVRAEEAGHDPDLRATFGCVTARSFAAPAITAECGAAFLCPGGLLLVSEPPTPTSGRWPDAGLAELGLRLRGIEGVGPRFAALEQVGEYPDRLPRRTGVPARRPLW